MTTVLPVLHEGHAPIFLHQAFDDALDAFDAWALNEREPEISIDCNTVRISSVFGRMRQCTDVLPARTVDAVKAVTLDDGFGEQQVTYAEAARLLRELSVDRLRG